MAITRIGPNQSINLASNITGTLPTGNGGTGSTASTLPASLINNTSIGNVTALPAAISTGKVLQVVQGTDTASRSTTSSSYVSGTINASITPSATSSKILVHITGVMRQGTFNIYRGSTDLGGGQGFGEAYTGSDNAIGAIHYLDSPSTTSSTTYTGYFKANYGGTAYFGVGGFTVITLMEIDA